MKSEGKTQRKLGKQQLKNRKRAGRYFKLLRKRAGYTQLSLSKLIGQNYYTYISQIENGQGRCPSRLYRSVAEIFNVPAKTFAMLMTICIDPNQYDALFGDEGAPTEEELLESLGLLGQ